jgi:hypothetical protein
MTELPHAPDVPGLLQEHAAVLGEEVRVRRREGAGEAEGNDPLAWEIARLRGIGERIEMWEREAAVRERDAQRREWWMFALTATSVGVAAVSVLIGLG